MIFYDYLTISCLISSMIISTRLIIVYSQEVKLIKIYIQRIDFSFASNIIYQNIKNSIENLPSGTDEEDWGQIKWMFTRDSQL